MSDRITPFDVFLMLLSAALFFVSLLFFPVGETSPLSSAANTIRWVDFRVPAAAMKKAYRLAVSGADSSGSPAGTVDWIDLLAYCAAKDGGVFQKGWEKNMDAFVSGLREGKTVAEITGNLKYFDYYQRAYSAVLGGFVGEYWEDVGNDSLEKKFGLHAFSPIAAGYGFSHYEDFGNSRSFGYQRRHLGNDLLGAVGTPVIAVEGGVVEACGWNRYGGWRIGIRSFDGLRYWYYAHLRKDHPYPLSLSEGEIVYPGQVIGYLGMTGYSDRENVNGMQKPHLHLGLQLIFDESQKEGNGEIWVDVYSIVEFLNQNRMKTEKNAETKDFESLIKIYPIPAS